MFFIIALRNSLWNVGWLIAQRKLLRRGFLFFTLFCIMLSIGMIVPFALVLPKVSATLQERVASLPDFSAKVEGGVLSVSGITQPLVYGNDAQLVVIDTTVTSSSALRSHVTLEYKEGVLVAGNDALVFSVGSGKEELLAMSDLPNTMVTKQDLVEVARRLTGGWMLVGLTFLAWVVLVIFLWVSNFLGVLVATVIAWVVARTTKRQWLFSEILTIGLFAVTLPTLIASVFVLLGIQIPFVFLLALSAFMVSVVLTKERTVSVDTTGPSV